MNQEVEVPSYFLCPISLQIMKDPVTVSTGITYDRETIEKWMFTNKNNDLTCPVTKQALNQADCLTPNHTLRRLIQSWCTLNSIERFPTPKPPVTRAQIDKIINEATRCPRNKLKCLKQLKGIASESTANKRCLEGACVVEFLARVVVYDEDNFHAVSEAISVLSQLHVSEEQAKNMIVDRDGSVFGSLARVIVDGSYEARASAVELMKLLLQVAEPAQVVSFKKEYFTSVVHVLNNINYDISPRTIKSCLKILNLACPWGRNRVRAVEAGVILILIDLLLGTFAEERRFTEMVLAVLDQLCGCAEGRSEFLGHGAGLAVVSKKILRVSPYATERAVRILVSISRFAAGNAGVVQEMVEVGVVLKLCLVLQVDCDSKTKWRAREILKLHAKTWGNSPCAPSHVFASL